MFRCVFAALALMGNHITAAEHTAQQIRGVRRAAAVGVGPAGTQQLVVGHALQGAVGAVVPASHSSSFGNRRFRTSRSTRERRAAQSRRSGAMSTRSAAISYDTSERDEVLSYLPLAHIAERLERAVEGPRSRPPVVQLLTHGREDLQRRLLA